MLSHLPPLWPPDRWNISLQYYSVSCILLFIVIPSIDPGSDKFSLLMKLVSIMLSCVWFSHPLSWQQWIGAVSLNLKLPFHFFVHILGSSINPVYNMLIRSLFLVLSMQKASWKVCHRNLHPLKKGRLRLLSLWRRAPDTSNQISHGICH